MTVSKDENTLRVTGSLDVRSIASLRAAVYRSLEESEGDVRVDISRAEWVDLTTLKMLAVANRAARRQDRRVVLVGGSPGVRRQLRLSHLRWMLPVELAQAPAPEPEGRAAAL